MLTPFQRIKQFSNQIVNIQKLQFGRRVIDGDGQVVCIVVAESGNGTVIVRAAPLAEEVWETVDKYLCARLLCVAEEKLFARQLAFAVFTADKATEQRCLNGR